MTWQSATNSETARTISRAELEWALECSHQLVARASERRLARLQAWAGLKLDFAAMTAEERDLIALGQSAEVLHPVHAERIAAVVEQYRRDR